MKTTLFAALGFAIAAAPFSPAVLASETLEWEDDFCSYTATVHPERDDIAGIESAVNLIYFEFGYRNLSPMIFPDPEAAAPDLAGYEAECAGAAADVASIRDIDVPGADAYVNLALAEISDACAFGRASIRALHDPSSLRDYAPAATACRRHIEALEDAGALRAAWPDLLSTMCKDNADVAGCRNRIEATVSGKDGERSRWLHAFSYGWNNCAIDHVMFNAERNAQHLLEELREAFEERYQVRSDC